MADNPVLYTSPTIIALAINGDANTPTLKGLTNDGKRLGVEIDPAGKTFGLFVLRSKGASAFSANGFAELYLIPKFDGSNYSDGSDSVAPPRTCLVGTFDLRADTSQHIIPIWNVDIPPTPFKTLLINRGGQAFTDNNDDNQLLYSLYSERIVTP